MDFQYNYIIEPPGLGDLITDPANVEMAVCVLSWIESNIQEDISKFKIPMRLELRFITFMGSYPAYLVWYENDKEQWEIESYLDERIDKFLSEVTVLDLVEFMTKGRPNWKKITLEMMKRDKVSEDQIDWYLSFDEPA